MRPAADRSGDGRLPGRDAVTQVAAVDDSTQAALVGVRMFPVRRLHLLHPADRREQARSVAAALAPLKMATFLHPADRQDVGALIDLLTTVLHAEGERLPVVNLSGGWQEYVVAALIASFLAGSTAFVVQQEDVVPVPVLRVSFPEVLSPTKLRLLQTLARLDGSVHVKDVAQAAGMTPSLVSYHVRGYRDRTGLERMGLVDLQESPRGYVLRLTPLGRILVSRQGREAAAPAAPSGAGGPGPPR